MIRAMILAAGRGERMRPLTDTVPKPLLAVGGKPLIVHHIENLARGGFRHIVVNHAHLGQMIEARLGDGSAFGIRIDYSREEEALETAGGIALALGLLGDGPFLVVNGDIYCELEFGSLARRGADMRSTGALAHLVLVANPEHHPKGDFVLEGARIRNDAAPRLTFSGIALYCPELFRDIVPGHKAKLAPLLRQAADAGAVTGEHFSGEWADVGTPQRLTELDLELARRSRNLA
jgi:MurNAc alpha-1-phosphate uridylyltransferase